MGIRSKGMRTDEQDRLLDVAKSCPPGSVMVHIGAKGFLEVAQHLLCQFGTTDSKQESANQLRWVWPMASGAVWVPLCHASSGLRFPEIKDRRRCRDSRVARRTATPDPVILNMRFLRPPRSLDAPVRSLRR